MKTNLICPICSGDIVANPYQGEDYGLDRGIEYRSGCNACEKSVKEIVDIMDLREKAQLV
jgi:peptide methionine sulfoxide reductase MsrA